MTFKRGDRVVIVGSLCLDTVHLIGDRGTVVGSIADGDGVAVIVDGEFRPTVWAHGELRADDGEFDRIGEALTSGSKNAEKLPLDLGIRIRERRD